MFLNLIIGVIINNMEDLKEEEKYKLAPKLEKIDKTEANMKILLNRIKKDMALLETHVSFLDDLEKRRLNEKI